jgi:SAM-dependent methyltransferase
LLHRLAFAALIWSAVLCNAASTNTPIPYVATHHDTVKDLLWLAEVSTHDVVYDLGSGDGRVAIAAVRDFGAYRAVGIEIDPALVKQSGETAAQAYLTDRVQFIHGDLFTNDFSAASVVVLYLGHTPNLDLRAKLVSTLKPGARIVSHQFGMGEWPPDKTLDVRTTLLGMYSEMHNPFADNANVPDFAIPFRRSNHDDVSVWVVPAPVAGLWQGKIATDSGNAELSVTLHQRLSGISGTFQLQSRTNIGGAVQAELWGTHLRFYCTATNQAYGQWLTWFDGAASNGQLRGMIWTSTPVGTRQSEWTAQRATADLTGNWQWSTPDKLPVQLQITRANGRLAATYVNTNQSTPPVWDKRHPLAVQDFYDFGGGFYFTLLLGEEGGSRRTGPEDGWLLGEAIVSNGKLSGSIAFYPYPAFEPRDASKPTEKSKPVPTWKGPLEWSAIRSIN